MGFGYNPQLYCTGERLEMLDYFSWFDKFLKLGVEEILIWDASCYSIVNKIDQFRSRETFSILNNNPSAKEVLECIIKEQEKNPDLIGPQTEIGKYRTNCQLREQYFRKFIEVLNIDVDYLNSWDVFRKDSKFTEALEKSLEFVKILEKEKPDLIRKINFNKKTNSATRLYLPLEIAESIYLRENRNIKTKFGPVSEKYFDIAIEEMFEELDLGYSTIRGRLTPGTDRPAYLGSKDSRVLGSKSTFRTIKRTLKFNPQLEEYLSSICEPFKGKYDDGRTETLPGFLRRVSMQLENKKEQIRGQKNGNKK